MGPLFLVALPFKLVNDASQFVGPVILNRLLTVVAGQGSQNMAAAGSSFNGTAVLSSGSAPGAAQQMGADMPEWLAWLETPMSNGYCLAFMLFFGTTLGVLADNQHFQRVMRAGFRLRSIVTAEVYRKVGGPASYERCQAVWLMPQHGMWWWMLCLHARICLCFCLS